MAADLPHVSFLGFEAVLDRLEVEGDGPGPSGRSVWRWVDGRARFHGERSVEVVAEPRTVAVSVEETLVTRNRDRLRTHTELKCAAAAPFSLVEWQRETVCLDRHGSPRPTTRSVDGGQIKRQEVRWQGSTRAALALSDRPVVTGLTWSHLAEHDAAVEVPPTRFVDVLDGLVGLSPAVRWQSCGRAVWKGHALRGWRCLGPAMVPMHAWTGPAGGAWMLLGMERAWVRASLLPEGP